MTKLDFHFFLLEMAYVGDTAILCQAIVDENLAAVQDWFKQENVDPNRRDYTGRTPLQLAAMVSSPEVVQCIVDNGARLIARMADGRTALHLAAARGSAEIVRILLLKSEENEEKEAQKQSQADKSSKARDGAAGDSAVVSLEASENSVADAAADSHSDSDSDADAEGESTLTESFYKIDPNEAVTEQYNPDDSNDLEPDVYNVNVVAWDSSTTALHLAILNGHAEVVEELVTSFGADVLLPVKITGPFSSRSRVAILTLVLALYLPFEKAQKMTATLLRLGASPAQADIDGFTAFQYVSASSHAELIDTFLHYSQPAVNRAIGHLSISGSEWNMILASPLLAALWASRQAAVHKLLELGASPAVEFSEFIKFAQAKFDQLRRQSTDASLKLFGTQVLQPVLIAVLKNQPLLARSLLEKGADPNTLTPEGYKRKSEPHSQYLTGKSLLDCVRDRVQVLSDWKADQNELSTPKPPPTESEYLDGLSEGSYKMWIASQSLKRLVQSYNEEVDKHKRNAESLKAAEEREKLAAKRAAVQVLLQEYKSLEAYLAAKGAKPFKELVPGMLESPPHQIHSNKPQLAPAEKPLRFSLTFLLPDLTDVTQAGYTEL